MTEGQDNKPEGTSSTKRIAEVLGDDDPSNSESRSKRPVWDPQRPPGQTPIAPPMDLATVLAQLAQSQQQQSEQMILFQQQQSQALNSVLQQLTLAISSHTLPVSSPVASQPEVPATPQPQATILAATVPTEQLSGIPVALDKVLLERIRCFKDAVFRLSKARSQLTKLKGDAAIFEKSDIDYPKKYKPFKSAVSFAELDHPCSNAASAPFHHEVIIPAGSSRRDAMAMVHRAFTKFMVDMQLEAEADHVASLELEASPATLIKLVQEVVTEASQPELAEEFGLPKPITSQISGLAIQARVDQLYKGIYEKLNAKLLADKAASDKSQRDELEGSSALPATSPDELLEKIVDKRIDTKLVEVGVRFQEDNSMQDHSDDISATAFVSSLPGNYQSPPEGVGPNTQQSAMPPSQRHRRSQPQGKGKGRPPLSATRPEKDKGKGKGKHANRQKGGKSTSPGKGKTLAKDVGREQRSTSFGKGGGKAGYRRGKPQA